MKTMKLTQKEYQSLCREKYSKGYHAGKRKEVERSSQASMFRVSMIVAAVGVMVVTLWNAAHAK